MIDSGIRVSERLALTKESIDWDSGLIRVKGKGNKSRIVAVSNNCRTVLWKYQNDHKYSDSLLFSTRESDKSE
jgi:site-specific recombinase XerD